MKRTYRAVLQAILRVLSDGKPHSYGELERKANTNWQTIRNHCSNLELFDAVEIQENKVCITERGRKILLKLSKM